MNGFLALLLLAIAGANADCNDGGRVQCYVALYQNNAIFDKESLCKQLPITQECVNKTECPMDKLDNYLTSLIKSCDTECDLFASIECSNQFKQPGNNMTFCRALEGIKKCYSENKCDQVVIDNPDFFKICENADDSKDPKNAWGDGRFGKILKRVQAILKMKSEPKKPATKKPKSN